MYMCACMCKQTQDNYCRAKCPCVCSQTQGKYVRADRVCVRVEAGAEGGMRCLVAGVRRAGSALLKEAELVADMLRVAPLLDYQVRHHTPHRDLRTLHLNVTLTLGAYTNHFF